jgi:endonuclease/exonuclease/phosphatase family metal-dependent hydrolase
MKKVLLSLFLLCMGSAVLTAQIVTIASFRARNVNDTIVKGEKVCGRITVSNQFRNTCYMQDATGGIAIYNLPFRGVVKVGDSVEISGGQLVDFQATTGQAKTGLSEIAGSQFNYIVIPGTASVPAPTNTSVQSVSEAVEGMLVKLRGVTFTSSGSFQGDKNYFVRNANGDSVQVRIDANTEIALNTLGIPTGAVDLVGVVSQFRGAYQVLPRFASDIGLNVEQDTVPKSVTFDITCWNVKNFMSTVDTTIKDKQRQLESVKRALDSINADLVSLQEVSNADGFRRLVDTLANPSEGLLAVEIQQDQKMAFIYRKGIVSKLSSGLAVNGGAQAWASGRFPLRMTFEANLNGVTKKMTAFSIHAKATGTATAAEDLARRTTDAGTFYEYLNTFYANDAVVVLGDFNDDVVKSVVGTNNPSPYKVFTDDTQRWNVLTKALSDKGLSSYLGSSGGMIDHIIVSNEVSPAVYRTKLETPQAFLSSFTSTVTDHVPVSTRLFLADVVTSVTNAQENAEGLRVAPNPASGVSLLELVHESEGVVRIDVLDMMGNTVHTVFSGTMQPQVFVAALPVSEWAAGAYTVRYQTSDKTTATRMVVTR